MIGTRSRGTALIAGLTLIAGLMMGTVAVPSAYAAGTPGLVKDASVPTAGPGDAFTYTLVPSCSGLQEGCVDAVLTDPLPPGVEPTALPQSTSEYTVAYDAATRTVRIIFLLPLPSPPNPLNSVGLTAGSSFTIEIGVQVPAESQITSGTIIANTATLTTTGAAPVPATASVTAVVARVVHPVASKAWSDGSAVAGSGETSTITLGVRNSSSSSAAVSSLTLDDATPAVFDRFDVTGVGLVSFPAGADRVTVLACTAAFSACSTGDYVSGPAQTGPNLGLPDGVAAAAVTGLRFVFTNSDGAPLPYDATGGSVQVATVLRDTLRSTGVAYAPTSRDDVLNCVGPSATDPVLGTVTGDPACVVYSVQPAQATIAVAKTFFSDVNGDFSADGRAVIGQNSPASALTTATNTSPFPVETMTITEPSASSASEYTKLDVTNLRLIFPLGSTSAVLTVTCPGGAVLTTSYTAPPATVNAVTGCATGSPTQVSVTYTGRDDGGNATIGPGAQARLGVRGTLNDTVTNQDVTDGVLDCADAAATSSINGVGSAAGHACAALTVLRAFSDVSGVKAAQLPTILPGLPRRFDLNFTNRGTIAATDVVMADPADPTAAGNSFDTVRLATLTVPANPAAVVEVYDPAVSAYVLFDATNADLVARARGFRVTVPTLAPGATYALNFDVILRDGVPAGTAFQNCAGVGSATQPVRAFCAGTNTVQAFSSGAAVQKTIEPASTVRPEAGLPGTPVQVKFAAQNTGTLFLTRLAVIDADPDFFDAVDVTGVVRVNFPPGSDRVRIDVCTGTCTTEADYTLGPLTGSATPPLPGGVPLADIRGIRVTFTALAVATPTNPSDTYRIRPGTNFPTTGPCTNASVCISVIPRIDLHSAPGTPLPATLSDTATGGFESTAQTPGTLAAVPPTRATHALTTGTAALRFAKSPDRSAAPGDGIPFFFSTTNTGTGPITGLTIVDPLAAQLDFSPLDATAPYEIAYTLPAGAPPPTEVTFTPIYDPSTGRATSLRWDFPNWRFLPGTVVSIGVRTALAPGVIAGSVIDNRAGASSARPDATCPTVGVPRPAQLIDDPAYGAGRYCTSAARVSVLAGNAIRTVKWVAGDDSLQYLDTLTGDIVALNSPDCPRRRVDGRQFTRYPCVARVKPGQAFDFFLEATNAGTNPATQLRIVDVFPHPNDTGVLLTNDARGTEWDQAPTLLGPVTLTGPGAATTTYTAQAAPVCTTDLNRPPVPCSAAEWPLAAYDPAATAFRSTIDFATPLPPGASTGLVFRMAAPAVPTNPAQNEVAWNSFAHTEFFQQGNTVVQLPPTEPIKTGVALVFGSLRITKHVIGGGTGTAGPFAITYQCSVTPQGPGGGTATPVIAAAGTVGLRDGESSTVENVPTGAACAVWETASGGLISSADGVSNAATVTIGDGSTDVSAVVTVTNTVPATTGPAGSTSPDGSPSSGSHGTASSSSPGSGSGGENGSGDGGLAATGGPVGAQLMVGLLVAGAGVVLVALGRGTRRSRPHR